MFRVPNTNQYCFCLSSARFWYWWCDDDFGKCLWQNVCLGIQSVVCQSWFTETVNITHCFKPGKTDAYLQWLRRLYAQRSGSVRANNFVLDIKREVKQGDALSPILFFHAQLGWTIQNWKRRMVSCWARWVAGFGILKNVDSQLSISQAKIVHNLPLGTTCAHWCLWRFFGCGIGQRKHKYFSRYIYEHVKRRFFSNRNAGSILVCASQPATNSDKQFFAFFWRLSHLGWGGRWGGATSYLLRWAHIMLR